MTIESNEWDNVVPGDGRHETAILIIGLPRASQLDFLVLGRS